MVGDGPPAVDELARIGVLRADLAGLDGVARLVVAAAALEADLLETLFRLVLREVGEVGDLDLVDGALPLGDHDVDLGGDCCRSIGMLFRFELEIDLLLLGAVSPLEIPFLVGIRVSLLISLLIEFHLGNACVLSGKSRALREIGRLSLPRKLSALTLGGEALAVSDRALSVLIVVLEIPLLHAGNRSDEIAADFSTTPNARIPRQRSGRFLCATLTGVSERQQKAVPQRQAGKQGERKGELRQTR